MKNAVQLMITVEKLFVNEERSELLKVSLLVVVGLTSSENLLLSTSQISLSDCELM